MGRWCTVTSVALIRCKAKNQATSASRASLKELSLSVGTATSCWLEAPSSDSSTTPSKIDGLRRPTRGCGIRPIGEDRRPMRACGRRPLLRGLSRLLPTRKRKEERSGPGKPRLGCICPAELKAPSSSDDQMTELPELERPTRGAIKYWRFGLLLIDWSPEFESPAEKRSAFATPGSGDSDGTTAVGGD